MQQLLRQCRIRFRQAMNRSKSRFRWISCIARVPEIVGRLAGCKNDRKTADPAAQARNCSLGGLAQIGLEFAERTSRVQVGRSVAPRTSIASRTPAALWAGRLSIMTMSLRLSVGQRTVRRYHLVQRKVRRSSINTNKNSACSSSGETLPPRGLAAQRPVIPAPHRPGCADYPHSGLSA